MFDSWIIGRTQSFAPDHANSGRLSGENRSRSVGRADRTGPIGAASVDWNSAIRRVELFSTISSYTTSAWLMPDCGCASFTLSIFTASTGRGTVAGSPTTPVRGAAGGGGAVVLVVASAVLGSMWAAGSDWRVALDLPPHAATRSASATRGAIE